VVHVCRERSKLRRVYLKRKGTVKTEFEQDPGKYTPQRRKGREEKKRKKGVSLPTKSLDGQLHKEKKKKAIAKRYGVMKEGGNSRRNIKRQTSSRKTGRKKRDSKDYKTLTASTKKKTQ